MTPWLQDPDLTLYHGDALTVSGDTIFEQSETTYDSASNTLVTTVRRRRPALDVRLDAQTWYEIWTADERVSRARIAGCMVTFVVTAYFISSTRWYYGITFWITSIPLFVVTVIAARRRWKAALVLNLLLFIGTWYSAVTGANPYLPAPLRAAAMAAYIPAPPAPTIRTSVNK